MHFSMRRLICAAQRRHQPTPSMSAQSEDPTHYHLGWGLETTIASAPLAASQHPSRDGHRPLRIAVTPATRQAHRPRP